MTVPAAAHAGRLGAIVRGSGAGSDKAAGFVAHFVQANFAKDKRYSVINLPATLGCSDRDHAERAFNVADDMIRKGKSAYQSLDLDAAVNYLNNALAKYERYAAYVTDVKKIADTLMLLGATHILRGEEKTGEKRLQQALAIYPQVQPDPRIFNPTMRQVFEKASTELSHRPTGGLNLSSNPGYAEVYVDDVFKGVTPLTVDNIPEGRHYIRLVKAGYCSYGNLIDVVGGDEASQNATLKPTAHFDDFDTLVDSSLSEMQDEPSSNSKKVMVGDAVDQLGVLLNADSIFLAEVRLDGERVEVIASQYDLNQQARVKTAKQVFAYDQSPDTYQHEIGDLIDRNFSPTTLSHKATSEAASTGGLVNAGSGVCFGMQCSTFKTVLLAGGAGGGAVLMVIGGVLWAVAGAANSQYRSLPQVDPREQSLRSSGEPEAVAGDSLFFVGVAAAVVGTTLYFVWNPTPSTKDVIDQTGAGGGGWNLGFAPLDGGGAISARMRF